MESKDKGILKKHSIDTPADEPEWSFLLEIKSGYLLFSSWTVRNLTLKGRLLCYADGDKLLPFINLGESTTVKLKPSSSKARQFRFQTLCKDGSKHTFNAAHEEAREKCIIMFNFAAKTGKWFYPFDELLYVDHPTMEIFGLPIKKPIYVPKTNSSSSSSSPVLGVSSSSGPIVFTTNADKKKAMTGNKPDGIAAPMLSPINQHKHHVPFSGNTTPRSVSPAPRSVTPPPNESNGEVRSDSLEVPAQPVKIANSPFPPSRGHSRPIRNDFVNSSPDKNVSTVETPPAVVVDPEIPQ